MNTSDRKPYFESERLLFFRPIDEDIESNLKWASRPETMKGEKKAINQDEAKEFSKIHWENYGFGGYTIFLKETNERIGTVGIKFFTPEHKIPDLGYLIYPPFQTQGFATEAAKALIKYAFETLGFKKIQALNYEKNKPSSNVLRKLGFKIVGKESLFYLGQDWGESTKWELELGGPI